MTFDDDPALTQIRFPKTAAQVVRDLAFEAMHGADFIGALADAWREVGLPGDLPLDSDGFIDLPTRESEQYHQIATGYDALAGTTVRSEKVRIQPALLIMFDRKDDVHILADAATDAGLEAYEFRHDVVVSLPPGTR